LLVVIGISLHALIHTFDYHRIVWDIRATSARSLLLAISATIASNGVLIGYDLSGLRYIRARVSWRVAALASFCAYALGNVVGFGPLTGGAVRYRFYSAAGLEPGRIARLILFCATAGGLGILGVAGASLLLEPSRAALLTRLPPLAVAAIGIAFLGLVAAVLCLCSLHRRPLALFGAEIELPGPGLAVTQLGLAALDITLSATVLWAVLPATSIGFVGFVAIYAIAIGLAAASHVPGGLGVFDGVVLLALAPHMPLNALAAALLVYRTIYFLGPLGLATLMLGGAELQRHLGRPLFDPARSVGRAIDSLLPPVLSAVCFLSGVMLLVSGVTPARQEVLDLLSLQVPLSVLEASQFLASIAGLVLLFVARGLYHRLDASWWIAFLVATANFGLVLTRGGDLDEQLVLGILLAVLAASRRLFRRHACLLGQAFTLRWLLAVGAVAAAVGWVLFFAYREVPYHHDLWWQFEFDAQAPRALRAGLAVLILLFIAALRYMFRTAPAPRRVVTTSELEAAQTILRHQDRPEANLALLGDKSLLFAKPRDAFIMYARHGRSWIALSDPVGSRPAWTELIWHFMEMAAVNEGRPVFYQIRPNDLALYLDCGLRVVKLGEEARVSLDGFSLKGPERANLRNSVSRGIRDGLSVELIEKERLTDLVPELALISAAWLRSNGLREKAFSLGAFRPRFVASQNLAVVRKGNRLIAFATIMTTDTKTEATIDLMRHLPEAPRSTMDFLFVQLIERYKAEGFASFSLGMTPLAGFACHPRASRWHRLGHLVYSHGEHFYNFQGLRAFKEKFAPVWQPRYLAAPSGLATYLALGDAAALINGGIRGMLAR
jgi:phosphatidylglycerol lysyltransferase